MALQKPATSSAESWGGTAAGLVDNDLSTYCHTNNGGWVMIDLGEEKVIGGIFLYATYPYIYDRAIGLYVEILDA